jgi:hypothetical protein
MFARLVSAPEIEQQLLRIERRRRQGDRSKDEQIENGGLCLRRRDALPVVAARKERELLGVLEGQK